MNDLKSSLAELADGDAPASTIDIDKARADGRRKMVAARLAPIATGVAVVAACGIAVSGLSGGSSPSSHDAASGSQTAPATQTEAPAAFTGTDPLYRHASFGQLPAGWTAGTVDDSSDYSNDNFIQKGTDPNSPHVNLVVTKAPMSGTLPDVTLTPTTVPGGTNARFFAFKLDSSSTPGYGLEWQVADGSWVSLNAWSLRLDQAGTNAFLSQLAPGVTVGKTPVALPLHIDGVPAGYQEVGTELNIPGLTLPQPGAKPWNVQLDFRKGMSNIVVTLTPSGGTPLKAGDQADKTTVPTLPPGAGKATKPDFACQDSNGLTVCVTAPKGDLDSVGGAAGLLTHITSLGTDPANWTTQVVGS